MVRGGREEGGERGAQDPLIRVISVPNPPIRSFLKSNPNPQRVRRKMIKKSFSIRLFAY